MQAREPIISNIERRCVLDLLLKKKRIDGRKLLQFRKTKVSFLEQLGGCFVEVGDTKVFSQVSCDICKPRATRPNEGLFLVNLDFSPMASPSFEADRWNELAIESNRIIERCLKDSGCLDIESLCIISGEVVWQIKVDIRVLNHEGNLVDACCISAIAALANFQRPDVTVYASEGTEGSNDETTIASDRPPSYIHGRIKFHSQEERAFVSLNIQHIPVCVSLWFYDKGNVIIADPTWAEEHVMEGKLIIAVNSQKQICTLHMSGGSLILTKEELLSHVHKAAKLCTDVIVAHIKDALKLDAAKRADSSLSSKLKAKLSEHEVPIAPLKESQVKKSDKKSRKEKQKKTKELGVNKESDDEPQTGDSTLNKPSYEIVKGNKTHQNFASAVHLKGNWRINAPQKGNKANKGNDIANFEGDEPEEASDTNERLDNYCEDIEREEIVISSDEDEQITVVV